MYAIEVRGDNLKTAVDVQWTERLVEWGTFSHPEKTTAPYARSLLPKVYRFRKNCLKG